MKLISLSTLARAALTGGALLWVIGCGSPNKPNIELRRQVQQLQADAAAAKAQHEADARVIASLRDQKGTVPTLPTTRLDRLFTTHGIQFGRLTGALDSDPQKPGDEAFVVYVVPTDQTGEMLKAAGTFDIEAFDLADPAHPLVGHWHFDLDQSKQSWHGALLEYAYALVCPFATPPKHPDLTVKVTFLDELTQTPFTIQKVIQINLPASRPTTQQ